MLLQFSRDLFPVPTCFCFNYIHNFLWTNKSRLFIFQAPKITQMLKCTRLLFVRTRAFYALHSGSQIKEVSIFSSPVDFKDKTKGKVIVLSSSSFSETLPSHSVLSSEYVGIAMHGWNISMAKPKNTQEWTQFWTDGSRTHMGHAHEHDDHRSHEKLGAYTEKILQWGLWLDIILTVGKVAAGYISGSTAIITDATHSALDIVLSGVALWSSKASKAPPDQEHPYGYGKIETMGALSISTVLLVTGGGIAWIALDTLQDLIPAMLDGQDTIAQATMDPIIHQEVHNHGHHHEHEFVGHKHVFDVEHMEVALFAALVGIVAKEGLYWITKAAGEKLGSALLKASAWHHCGDAVSTIVALIGVGGAMMGMPLLDPAAALLVSGMIVKAGLETCYQSMQELLDKGLPQSFLEPIRKLVLQVDGIKGIHQLKGRQMGSTVYVDIHIEVDPWLSVCAAHHIGEVERQQVRIHHQNVTESFIHIDPANEQPSPSAPERMVFDTTAKDKHLQGHYIVQQPRPHSHGDNDKHHHNNHSHGEEHDHDHSKRVNSKVKEEDESMRDLTKVGSKAEHLALNSSMSKDEHGVFHNKINALQQVEVGRIVKDILQANFYKVVKVNAVTCHFWQGKVVAEVGISLNPNLSIWEAMQHASDMESCLLQNVKDLAAIRVQLNLSSN